jgi:hypothetical protein
MPAPVICSTRRPPGGDAARTPYPGRHLGTLRDRARCARLVCRDPDNRDLCILVAAALTWAAHSSVATTCVAADIFATEPKYASMPPIRTGTNRPAFASIGFGSGRFPPQKCSMWRTGMTTKRGLYLSAAALAPCVTRRRRGTSARIPAIAFLLMREDVVEEEDNRRTRRLAGQSGLGSGSPLPNTGGSKKGAAPGLRAPRSQQTKGSGF